jgi:hypothetical protein
MFLARALRVKIQQTTKNEKPIGSQEVFMATEVELFYPVLLVILTLIIHFFSHANGAAARVGNLTARPTAKVKTQWIKKQS